MTSIFVRDQIVASDEDGTVVDRSIITPTNTSHRFIIHCPGQVIYPMGVEP